MPESLVMMPAEIKTEIRAVTTYIEQVNEDIKTYLKQLMSTRTGREHQTLWIAFYNNEFLTWIKDDPSTAWGSTATTAQRFGYRADAFRLLFQNDGMKSMLPSYKVWRTGSEKTPTDNVMMVLGIMGAVGLGFVFVKSLVSK